MRRACSRLAAEQFKQRTGHSIRAIYFAAAASSALTPEREWRPCWLQIWVLSSCIRCCANPAQRTFATGLKLVASGSVHPATCCRVLTMVSCSCLSLGRSSWCTISAGDG